MTNNYFAVEHNGKTIEHVVITNDNGETMFGDLMNMSYEDMKRYKDIDAFVATVFELTNNQFGNSDEQTIITLIDENDVFIWGILMGPGKGDEIKYAFIDWRADSKLYKYEN